ncbi:MAG: hypothetical protein NTU63_00195 [Candidatus Pacearchaeota archaeon]|nr:hypothetical protein [Candidatus Pacearchaeota archaeon]
MKRGQVWVETVIYTLLAFIMIGLVVSYVKPKVEEMQDKTIIEQSSEMMKEIDSTILSMSGAGNQRIFEIRIKEGQMKVDGVNELLIFETDSKYMYTEPGKKIEDGNIVVYTEKKGSAYAINLTLDYSGGYNITFEGRDEKKTVSRSSNSYKLSVLNKGTDPSNLNRVILDFSLD